MVLLEGLLTFFRGWLQVIPCSFLGILFSIKVGRSLWEWGRVSLFHLRALSSRARLALLPPIS